MASQWERASAAWEPWFRSWHWLLVAAPIGALWAAQVILDSVVACDLVAGSFFAAPLSVARPIGPGIALAIHGWGLAFMALCVLALASWVLAARLLLHALPGAAGGRLLLLLILASAAVLIGLGAAGWLPISCLAEQMMAGTAKTLPDGASTGNPGARIDAVQAWGGGALVAAGIAASLAAAAALQPTPDEAGTRERARRLRHLLLAAAAMLSTAMLTAHLYLEVGAQVVDGHAAPGLGAALAGRFDGLRAAVEVYFAGILSLALVALYLPAAAVLWLRLPSAARAQARRLPLAMAGRLAVMLSPLIAVGALEAGNAVVSALAG